MSKSLTSRLVVALLALTAVAGAKEKHPEDFLAGQIIISDQSLPMSWTSVSAYVGRLKSLNKTTLWFDKNTGKAKVNYAAFFRAPVDDVQVTLQIFDITDKAHRQLRTATDNFMRRGDRVLFNSVELDKEDFAMNKKYQFVIATRGRAIATGEFLLRGEAEHYSGKVNFSEDEVKKKD